MNKRSRYLFKNIGILTLSNFATRILVFLLVPLYTSVLSTDDVGTYDLIISTISLLYPILTANIVDAVMRFTMDTEKSNQDVLSIGIHYVSKSWIIAGILIYIIRCLNLFPQINGFEILIFLYFVFFSFYQLLLQFAKGIERITDMGIAGVISTIAMIISNILFLLVLKIGLKGFFIANLITQICPTIYLFVRLKIWNHIKKYTHSKELEKEMLVYSIPLIATTLGWWVNNTSDKYVVAVMVGVGANGLLSVSYKIPQIINTLQGIFIQAWQISAIKEYGEKDTSFFYGRAFKFVNVLMCVACCGLIFLTKPIGHVLYKKDFFDAWEYVPFLLISCVINSAASFLGPILAAKKDSKSMALSAVYGATTNIIMNLALVYLIGIQGATIATVISSFIIYTVRKRSVGQDIKIDRYRIVIITWIFLCAQAIFEVYTPFWWIEILLIGSMLVLNRREITEIIIICLGIYKRKERKTNENCSDNSN